MSQHTPPAHAAPSLEPLRPSRALVRNVLLGLVTLDLVVLAAFAVHVETVTTRTTSAPLAAPAAPVATGVAPVAAVPAAAVPPAVGAGVPLGGAGAPTTAATPGPSDAPEPSDPPEASEPPEQPSPDETAPPCPVHVGDNRTDGGLQSLIDFAPAFGPFSAEAFAAASAYQPALQLIGPILAKYPRLAPQLKPVIGPPLDAWAELLAQGYTVVEPLYAPYRTSVLEAETTFAAQLAPYVRQLAGSPEGSCLVELQNALLHDGPDS